MNPQPAELPPGSGYTAEGLVAALESASVLSLALARLLQGPAASDSASETLLFALLFTIMTTRAVAAQSPTVPIRTVRGEHAMLLAVDSYTRVWYSQLLFSVADHACMQAQKACTPC